MRTDVSGGPDRQLRNGRLLAAGWLAAGGAFGIDALDGSSGTGRTLMVVALVASALAAVIGVVEGERRHDARYLGYGLIVSALLMPTSFAYALNLVPLIVGLWFIVRARRTTHSMA